MYNKNYYFICFVHVFINKWSKTRRYEYDDVIVVVCKEIDDIDFSYSHAYDDYDVVGVYLTYLY